MLFLTWSKSDSLLSGTLRVLHGGVKPAEAVEAPGDGSGTLVY